MRDDVSSPCIDAADPASPYDGEPYPHGSRSNIGAYGNTPEASKSFPNPDIDDNGCVNVTDLLFVRTTLGASGSDIQPPACDVDGNGVVNVTDFMLVRISLREGCR